jgi:hypothetical protein
LVRGNDLPDEKSGHILLGAPDTLERDVLVVRVKCRVSRTDIKNVNACGFQSAIAELILRM